jgi:hypothetical protein
MKAEVILLLGLITFLVVMFFVACFRLDSLEEQIKAFKNEAIERNFATWQTDGVKIEFIWNEK